MVMSSRLKPLLKTNYQMKKITYLTLIVLLFVACGSNKSKVADVEVEIPEILKNNEVASELIENMTAAVNVCRNNMVLGAQFALEQEKTGVDSLSIGQGLKAAKFAAKMMLSAKKIENIREEVVALKSGLSENEWLALDNRINELEASIGNLTPEELGLSEEDVERLKAKEKPIETEGTSTD